MLSSFFKKSASKRSVKDTDLEDKENCPFLNEAEGRINKNKKNSSENEGSSDGNV